MNHTISHLLRRSRTIAIVGLSAKTNRPSFEVAYYLQQNGYRIVPVNPTYAGTRILGELCYSSLREAANEIAKENLRIDIVDCFRRSDAIDEIADEAITIHAHCLWMQLGVINQEAAAKASLNGMQVVMDRCIKIEHMQLARSR